MSEASSGDDSELEPEVPTEVPSDVEEDVASEGGVPGPSGPTATPPSPAMSSAPVVAANSPGSVAEPEALAKLPLPPRPGVWNSRARLARPR